MCPRIKQRNTKGNDPKLWDIGSVKRTFVARRSPKDRGMLNGRGQREEWALQGDVHWRDRLCGFHRIPFASEIAFTIIDDYHFSSTAERTPINRPARPQRRTMVHESETHLCYTCSWEYHQPSKHWDR